MQEEALTSAQPTPQTHYVKALQTLGILSPNHTEWLNKIEALSLLMCLWIQITIVFILVHNFMEAVHAVGGGLG